MEYIVPVVYGDPSIKQFVKLIFYKSFEFHKHGVRFRVGGGWSVRKLKDRLLEFYFHSRVLSNQVPLA